MQTLICEEPGRFVYKEKEYPAIAEGHTLLRIKKIGICGTDLHAFEGTQPYFTYPRILGHELSAEIVQTDAEGFETGELVTVIPYFNCGNCIACRNGKPNCCASLQVLGVHVDGGMQEYITIPSSSLVKNNGLSEEELALVEPLSIGAHGVRRANIQPREFVLVIGAGPIGLGTMEFARIAGAKVIAMDILDSRLDFCIRQLQVTYRINAAKEAVTEKLKEITGGDMPSVVIDATGSLKAIDGAFQYLSHGGRFILIGLQKGAISVSHPEFHKCEATLMSSRNATREDFDHVIRSIKNGQVKATNYITHQVLFREVADQFPSFSDPDNGVIKAMISFS